MFFLKKRRYRVFKYIVLIPIIILSGCTTDRTTHQEVEIVKAQSYYSDFYVNENSVYIKCYITLHNNVDLAHRISLCAHFPDDKIGGLLVEENLYSKSEDGELIVYTIQPNSTESIEVLFTGTFAGNNVKHDRNLPDVEILILD